MARHLRRISALILALVICAGMLGTVAFAEDNVWYGNQVAVDVVAGSEGYNYMALFRKYAHGYEFSGHFMGDGEGPQTFVVIDTAKYAGTTWRPSGLYAPNGGSNYEVMYCCDVETMIVDGTYYKRLNLEDSGYYSDAMAARIRAIVTNSYPYVSEKTMRDNLVSADVPGAENLTRNDLIAAVQTAIWACANNGGDPMRYAKSYRVSDNLQWGYPMYDTSAESGLDVAGKRVFKPYEEVGTRIDGAVDYLLSLGHTYADKAQIVITEMEMVGAPVALNSEEYLVNLSITLNNSGSGYEDDINITVYVDGAETVLPVVLGQKTYELQVVATTESTIKAVVSGTQVLPKGVYFYAPKGSDGEPARDISQNLVGVAMGKTPVYAEKSISFDDVTFKSGGVSNISYMFINKETGEVEFLKKIDVDEGATSAPIIKADGYVSVMFMKQSTSGMFWFSEEVSESKVNAAIECLKANNPSYKGHNAIAYGAGAHELEFKKNKFVTYYFGEEFVDTEEESEATFALTVEPTAEPTVEPVVEPTVEPVVEPTAEPVVEEIRKVTVSFKKGEASHIGFLYVDKQTGKVTFDSEMNPGKKDTSAEMELRSGCISVMYIKKGDAGMIWTSEEVSKSTMDSIISALENNDDAYEEHDVMVYGDGAHKVTYTNKKTESVTYTIEGTGNAAGEMTFEEEIIEETVEETVEEPTAEPTEEPTAEPTVEPTAEPTAEPTVEPTAEPVVEPTAEPTVEPTAEPTVEPTAEPTVEPTAEPTVEPTAEPTVEPTAEPTVEPTAEPTVEPTAEPTVVPTAAATEEPTADLTAEPEESEGPADGEGTEVTE